jgi:predicted nuclease of predicted toxin-antitoxin system
MKILADESIESEVVAGLRSGGHEVEDIKELSPGISDEQVLLKAIETDSILLTNDKDFGELIFRDRRASNGVILLRFGRLELSEKQDLLAAALKEYGHEIAGSFTVLTSVGVRIKK